MSSSESSAPQQRAPIPKEARALIRFLDAHSDKRGIEDRSAGAALRWQKAGNLTSMVLSAGRPTTPPPTTEVQEVQEVEVSAPVPFGRRKGKPPPAATKSDLAPESRALLAALQSEHPPTDAGFGGKVMGSQLINVFPHSDAARLKNWRGHQEAEQLAIRLAVRQGESKAVDCLKGILTVAAAPSPLPLIPQRHSSQPAGGGSC
jgi:hypothetical protein